jgi:ankyrin repeat protein
MPASILRLFFPFAVLAVLSGCGSRRDDEARKRIHAAGFAFLADDFLRAAREGREEIVREFLAAGMNAGVANERGETAVACAAAGGHGHVVALLLSRGAPPNAGSAEGETALLNAAQSGDAQSVSALLAAGADGRARDRSGLTPLAAAVLAGHAAVVELLADSSAESLDHALQLAAVKGHTAVMSVLMDRGASYLAAGADGRTPMMFAAQYGHMEAVKLLRQRGASVTALDGELKTAASHAADNGYDDIAAWLREPERHAGAPWPAALPKLSGGKWNPGSNPTSLAEVAASVRMVDFRERTLPLMVEDVPEGEATATVRVSGEGDETITVAPGDEIPQTNRVVESVRRCIVASRHRHARMIDAPEVLLRDRSAGRPCLAVKGFPVTTGEGCAMVGVDDSDELFELCCGDEFKAGAIPLRVAEVRPLHVVLERTDTGERASVARNRAP